MKPKTFDAIITSITEKVMVTGHRLEKPDVSDYYELDISELAKTMQYVKNLTEYEASEFTAEVENVSRVKQGWLLNNVRSHPHQFLKLNQSCLITETGEGRCEIIKLE